MASRDLLLTTSTDAANEAWTAAQSMSGDGDLGESLGTLASAIVAALNGVRCAIMAGIAEPEPPAVTEAPAPPLSTWAYLELMGHRVIVGYVEEDDFVGRSMLRVRRLQQADRQPGIGEPAPPLELEERWRIYSPASVFSFEAITETEARDRWLSIHGGAYRNDDIPF